MNRSITPTEAYFIPHCDDFCGLGRVFIECPACNNHYDDFDLWYSQDELMDGQEKEFECVKCKANLILRYHLTEYYYQVIPRKI